MSHSAGRLNLNVRLAFCTQVLISIGLGWLLCHILTVAGRLPDDPDDVQYPARTDSKADTVELASWFYFPYPGNNVN